MELLRDVLDLFLHLDEHLYTMVNDYRSWTYLILFLIIFCETGLVVTPILPGDSLLFAAGAIAALGSLNVLLLVVILIAAAILGDSANYAIGKFLGKKVFEKEYRFIKKEYLIRTHNFYEKHGGKTIIIARFIPIIRTFAPFVAGVGVMTYPRFILFNVIGAILWVVLATYAGYFFGNIEIVKKNFSVVILAIIFISILPMVFEYLRHRMAKSGQKA
jgi:membrane-associated protein